MISWSCQESLPFHQICSVIGKCWMGLTLLSSNFKMKLFYRGNRRKLPVFHYLLKVVDRFTIQFPPSLALLFLCFWRRFIFPDSISYRDFITTLRKPLLSFLLLHGTSAFRLSYMSPCWLTLSNIFTVQNQFYRGGANGGGDAHQGNSALNHWNSQVYHVWASPGKGVTLSRTAALEEVLQIL